MIFKLYYWLFFAGLNAVSILLGVFIKTYTDASSLETGALFMVMPFCGLISRPILCLMADRAQAHKKYLIICLLVISICYSTFIIIPYVGPGLYKEHSRVSWYILVSSKIAADVAIGGATALVDTLTVNYAKRIGTEYGIYRVWGTISWMVFGIITGNINELPFMPKYTPAFMVLVACNILNAFLLWLWPDEYFRIVSEPPTKDKDPKVKVNDKSSNMLTKSLMPKEVVWTHMKAKLADLFNKQTPPPATETFEMKTPDKTSSMFTIELAPRTVVDQEQKTDQNAGLDKKLQVKILFLLIRRDPRILLYSIFFLMAGLSASTMQFFVMSLPDVCSKKGTCNGSVLTGYIQVAMSGTEAILFMLIGRIQKVVGRLNLCSLGMLCYSLKYLFYATFYQELDPRYALLVETLHGFSIVTVLTVLVEMSRLFASEVEFIVPELLQRGLIKQADSNVKSLKMSLSATMQAFTSSSHDCLGPGIGALVYGVLLERITYSQLWLVVGSTMGVVFAITMVINIADKIFRFNLGLDAKVKADEKVPSDHNISKVPPILPTPITETPTVTRAQQNGNQCSKDTC